MFDDGGLGKSSWFHGEDSSEPSSAVPTLAVTPFHASRRRQADTLFDDPLRKVPGSVGLGPLPVQ